MIMRVLLIGRDSTGLDKASATFGRWRAIRDAGVELICVISSRNRVNLKEGQLRVVSSTGLNFAIRIWNVFWIVLREARQVDLISAQDPFELGLIAYFVAKILKKPFEIQDHGGFYDGRDPGEPFWSIRRRLTLFLAKRAKLIRTVSPGSVLRLSEMGYGEKVVFIPIATHSRFESAHLQVERYHVVSTGRLIKLKRHDLLIKAFAIFAKDISQARLSILGDGPQRHELEQLISDLHLVAKVELVGNVDPLPFLQRANCFVMSSMHEGWGVAAVEAAVAGVPVVMTDTGCARWLEDRGRAFVARVDCSPEELARMIEKACNQKITHGALEQPHQISLQIQAWKHILQP